jgi:hypothetical protein
MFSLVRESGWLEKRKEDGEKKRRWRKEKKMEKRKKRLDG